MYKVQSNKCLTADIIEKLPVVERVHESYVGAIASHVDHLETPTLCEPIAIIGIHGISPIQRYAFQNQLAGGLLSYLNAVESSSVSGRVWRSMAYWPRIEKDSSSLELKPNALRLYRDDEITPETPSTRVFDVYEGYWSPLSKGKTNIVSVLQWLIGCTFLATSSTAAIPASWKKVVWDVGYLLVSLFLAVVLIGGAVLAGANSWSEVAKLFPTAASSAPTSLVNSVTTFREFASDPLNGLSRLSAPGYIQLVITIIIGYFLIQLFIIARVWNSTNARTRELLNDASKGGRFERKTISANAFHSVAMFVSVLIVALLLLVDRQLLAGFGIANPIQVGLNCLWLVASVACIQLARYIADFVVEDVLGDIQVYTTHDCNAEKYAIRSTIISTVTDAVLGPLMAVDVTKPQADGRGVPLYDRIHVIGHSLGATIGLDVLIRLRQLEQEGALDSNAWGRLRSLTTFGAALEKTRFLFNVRHPTVSVAQDQWANDIYGQFFSDFVGVLSAKDNKSGIYWSNHYYDRDIVANEIVSYESDVAAAASASTFIGAPGPHAICQNYNIPSSKPFYAWVHSDYLSDPLFWDRFGLVVTR